MSGFGLELLGQGARELGLEISDEQLAAFERYAGLLLDWNDKMNLTSVEPAEWGKRHFLDSISVLGLKEFGDQIASLADVGSGAGFPGLPIKIMRPDLRVTLIESKAKKAAFLKRVVMELELSAVQVLNRRLEDCADDALLRHSFDCAVARALAARTKLEPVLKDLVKPGGLLIVYGKPGEFEIVVTQGT